MMDFHKAKMYKDKDLVYVVYKREVYYNVKVIFVNVWRKNVFNIYFRY